MSNCFQTQQLAIEAANELKSEIKKGEWEIVTWENTGGWYFQLTWKYISITQHPVGSKYMALVGYNGTGIVNSFHANQDVNKLIDYAIKNALIELKHYSDIVDWLNMVNETNQYVFMLSIEESAVIHNLLLENMRKVALKKSIDEQDEIDKKEAKQLTEKFHKQLFAQHKNS